MTAPPQPRPPSTRWRPPNRLRRIELRLRNELWQRYAVAPGKASRGLGTTLGVLDRARLLHNRVAFTEFAAGLRGKDTAMATMVTSATQGMADLDVAVEHADDDLRAHDARRPRRDSKRPHEYNGLRVGDRAARPSEKPCAPSTMRKNLANRRRLFNHMRSQGHHVTVRVEVPKKTDHEATNAITWYSMEYVNSGVRSHIPGDRGFEHAHYTNLDEEGIRQARCSWVDRLDGLPIFRCPDGRKVLLGPHYKPIEGTRNQRMHAATPANPDPLLWPSDTTRPGDIESALTPEGHVRRLRRATGIPDVQPSILIETGLAAASLLGAPPDYQASCQNLTSKRSILDMEAFAERVLNAVEEDMDLGLAAVRHGAILGFTTCDVCLLPQELGAAHCSNCEAPMEAPVTPADPILQLKLTVQHVLDVLDDIRNAAGEPHDPDP